MAGNSFGQIFKVTTFGESHGSYIGVVVDGCPAGLFLDLDFIQLELDKRKPGQNRLSSSRNEDDKFEIISGTFEGKTTGTPLCIMIKNKDVQSEDYLVYKDFYRPSHADFTYQKKYGIRDHRGGGRASARETAARVVAGAIAKLILKNLNIIIFAYSYRIGEVVLQDNYELLDLSLADKNEVKCPDAAMAIKMIAAIETAKFEGDSIGGIVQCIIQNCPAGLGEPVFDKFDADLAKAMLSINAAKGFEIGSGFYSSTIKGSENNDDLVKLKDGSFKTKTNNSGGVLGGITNAQDIYFRVAFKPTPTFAKARNLVDEKGEIVKYEDIKGRFDPCIVPRAVPVVEAMAAIVTVDHLFRNRCANLY